jgi:hypothetical protein
MADPGFFLKNGFAETDRMAPDFRLLVRKRDSAAPDPFFRKDLEIMMKPYREGLTIIRSDQCPYSVKNVQEMAEIAEKELSLTPKIVTLKTAAEAQSVPCGFGTFAVIYQGEVVAHHPVSSRRFMNIMQNKLSFTSSS